MTKNPQTVTMFDNLATAKKKMSSGGFRHLPVLADDRVVGIVTDRDIRQFHGLLERTKVKTPMTYKVLTVRAETTLEEAARLMVDNKFGALPVVREDNVLMGIVTTTDLLRSFLEVMGASVPSSFRIDLLLEGNHQPLAAACQAIADHNGEILGIGTYRERWEKSSVYYIRLRNAKPEEITLGLKKLDFNVLGVRI